MLKLKVYANENLQMPEKVLTGVNTVELLDPYLIESPVTGKYTTLYGRYRRTARYTGVPLWGIERGKSLQNCAFIIDNWVKLGLAEWMVFIEEEFDPRKAICKIRSDILKKQKPKTLEHIANATAGLRKFHATVSAERKAEINAAKREGWKKRRERLAAADVDKKTQRKIDSGRLPKPGEILPDWMKLADKQEK